MATAVCPACQERLGGRGGDKWCNNPDCHLYLIPR